MKKLNKFILIFAILLTSSTIYSQNRCRSGLSEQLSNNFVRDNVVPIIGDTIISPLRIKKDYSFELDYSKSKRLIVDSIRLMVYEVVNNKRYTLYDGYKMIEFDHCRYTSITIIKARCLDYSGSCSVNFYNIETDDLTKDNPNRKFIFIHDETKYGTEIEIRFIN